MNLDEKISTIEAILFACGDPLEVAKISVASGFDSQDVIGFITILNDRYEKNCSALKVVLLDKCYQLVTREKYSEYIKNALENKRSTPLSNAAMEALTIIAYNQPVTKGFVEHVRGVDSVSIVNSLVEKSLVEESGRLDVPGKPIAYKTTSTFLRCFGLNSLDDLPPLPNKHEQVNFESLLIINNTPDDNTEE